MGYKELVWIILATVGVVWCDVAQVSSGTVSPTPYPYIPHATYNYADTYGTGVAQTRYEDGPVQEYRDPPRGTAVQLLQTSLRIMAKVGLFFGAGMVLLVIGTIFTSAFCSMTPYCTLTFDGWGGINKETMRSLMNPERIASTAALVQDAIGKYQRLQRAVNSM